MAQKRLRHFSRKGRKRDDSRQFCYISDYGRQQLKRSMMQIYIKNSAQALEFYKQAFVAEVVSYLPNEDGTLLHAELDIYGQILALSESGYDAVITGNAMQFCLHFGVGKEEIVRRIYDKLRDGATVTFPIGECMFSPLMYELIDKYGVNWCVFV